jgi:hypothetical protein
MTRREIVGVGASLALMEYAVAAIMLYVAGNFGSPLGFLFLPLVLLGYGGGTYILGDMVRVLRDN